MLSAARWPASMLRWIAAKLMWRWSSAASGELSSSEIGRLRMCRPRVSAANTQRALVAKGAHDVGAIHVIGMKVFPHRRQPPRGVAKIARVYCQHRSIDGAGGGAADHREWRGRAARHHLRDGAQHAHLIRGARAAAGKDEAGGGRRRGIAGNGRGGGHGGGREAGRPVTAGIATSTGCAASTRGSTSGAMRTRNPRLPPFM